MSHGMKRGASCYEPKKTGERSAGVHTMTKIHYIKLTEEYPCRAYLSWGTLLYWGAEFIPKLGFFTDFLYISLVVQRWAGVERSAPFCVLISLKRRVRAAYGRAGRPNILVNKNY
jgi:hypothetical protein